MKSTNVAAYHETPRMRCIWCLRPAWAGGDTCRACRGIAAYQRQPVTDAHALTGGRWVQRGLVQVWDGPRDTDVDPQPRRQEAECGTDSGYNRHLKRGEKTCDACREAKREEWRRRKQRNVA